MFSCLQCVFKLIFSRLIKELILDKVSVKREAFQRSGPVCLVINPIPNNKILDWSKLKAFADEKINAT